MLLRVTILFQYNISLDKKEVKIPFFETHVTLNDLIRHLLILEVKTFKLKNIFT